MLKFKTSILLVFLLVYSFVVDAGTPTTYQNAFNQLKNYIDNPSQYSLDKAVFSVENAFYNDSLSWQSFNNTIVNDSSSIANLIVNDSLSTYDAIFQFFCNNNWSYNFNDFYGEDTITSIFVHQLMQQKTGTCFSYPIYYNILARRFNVPAALSILPNHLYAQIPVASYNQVHTNIELGSCQQPADIQYLPEFNITPTALQNGIYMFPLNIEEEILLLMNHLFIIYESEFGYDNWVMQRLIELLDYPTANNHILILMQYASCLNQLGYEMEQADVPNQQEYMKIVNAYVGVTAHIDNLGYVPETQEQYEAYQQRLALARENELQNGQNNIDTTALSTIYAPNNDALTNYYNEQLARNETADRALGLLANFRGNYRFGFNGMEKDDEVSGEGNSYTTHFRSYDDRIVRWKSLDPVTHEWQSPYSSFNNNPVIFADPSGAAGETGKDKNGNITWTGDVYDSNGNMKVVNAYTEAQMKASGMGPYIGDEGSLYNKLNSVNTLEYEKFSYQAPDRYAWDMDEVEKFADGSKETTSILVDFTPWGTLKGVPEVISNKDLITGEKIGPVRWVGLLPVVGGLRHSDKLAPVLKISKTIPKLSDEMAATFLGNKYVSTILEEDMILYRVGVEGQGLGQYFSREIPVSEIQTRIDKAIPYVWPGGQKAVLNTVHKVKIPKGTVIHTGTVGPQGGIFLGGTEQIVVVKPWLIEGVEVLESTPLKY